MREVSMEGRRVSRDLAPVLRKHWLIVVLLSLQIIVGIWVGRDYGLSWDESRNAQVGELALRVYAGSGGYFDEAAIGEHGPLYFMAFSTFGRIVHTLDAQWTIPDGRHLMNYLTLVLGTFFLYLLSLRLLPPPYAALTACLFMTQPLIFGHGFINQKDIPFMTFFLGSVVTGLSAADRLAVRPAHRATSSTVSWVQPDERTSTSSVVIARHGRRILKRPAAIAACVVCLAIASDLLFLGYIYRSSLAILYSAYSGKAFGPIQTLFSLVATDAYKTPFNLYVAKLDQFFVYARELGAPCLILAAGVIPSTLLPSVARFWGFDWQVLLEPKLIVTGLLLGATVCVRQVGGFALALVAIYWLLRLRRRALFPLLICFGIAAGVTILSWPYLWPDPLGQLIISVRTAVNFPTHGQLFEGTVIRSNQLPWFFFPTMFSIEITEPAVLLVCFGVLLAGWRLIAHSVRSPSTYLVLGLWVLVPLFLLLFSDMAIYGNIRQLLFLLPPLFVFAGVGAESILNRVRLPWLGYTMSLLAILPGVVGIVRLHPYEYVYYNAFVGGVRGVDSQFELDRWCTAFREAIEVVNAEAPAQSAVYVPVHDEQVLPFARPDLVVMDDPNDLVRADFVLSCTYVSEIRSRGAWDKSGFRRIYEVKRQDAILASVWERVPSR